MTAVNEQSAKFVLGKMEVDLKLGEWSPVLEISFKAGFMVSIKITTRVILTQIQPDPVLYFLPLQLHPLGSPWPYGTPKGMLKNIGRIKAHF